MKQRGVYGVEYNLFNILEELKESKQKGKMIYNFIDLQKTLVI